LRKGQVQAVRLPRDVAVGNVCACVEKEGKESGHQANRELTGLGGARTTRLISPKDSKISRRSDSLICGLMEQTYRRFAFRREKMCVCVREIEKREGERERERERDR
jgi:hypothetical protein